MSRFHFCRQFTKTTGLSFRTFLARQRIARATELLRDGTRPISHVGQELGFRDPTHFGRVFQKVVGMLPSEYRNAMGNMADKRDMLIRRERIPVITECIREKNKERRMLVVASDTIGYYDDNESRIRGNRSPICCWEGCQAGISSLYIDSVGHVKGCGAMYAEDFIEGNVRTRSARDIWTDANAFSYRRRFSPDLLDGDCRGCDVGDVCKGGCRASNFFSSGSLYKNSLCSRVTSCATLSAP